MKDNAPQPPSQRIADGQWREIEKTLPENSDAVRTRAELERIACDDRTPMARAKECEERARRNRASLQVTEKGSALAEQLTQQIRLDDEQARIFRQVAQQREPRKLLRQYEILALWENSGGSLRISTPRKSQSDVAWPDPYGPVIDYFRAAAEAIFGKAPSASQIKDILRRYRHLKFGAATFGGVMGGHIDDSKVFIIPAQK